MAATLSGPQGFNPAFAITLQVLTDQETAEIARRKPTDATAKYRIVDGYHQVSAMHMLVNRQPENDAQETYSKDSFDIRAYVLRPDVPQTVQLDIGMAMNVAGEVVITSSIMDRIMSILQIWDLLRQENNDKMPNGIDIGIHLKSVENVFGSKGNWDKYTVFCWWPSEVSSMVSAKLRMEFWSSSSHVPLCRPMN
ncbi:hypothetical protein HDU89_001717 [Geranomyces variabilis]|nr:hypothetical protein HDU89_001717 [Geranomyces variabilis]